VGEAGAGQREVGEAAARQGRARSMPLSGSGAVRHGTWPVQRRRGGAEKKQRREREGRRRGTEM
jgi:hypothetical protein